MGKMEGSGILDDHDQFVLLCISYHALHFPHAVHKYHVFGNSLDIIGFYINIHVLRPSNGRKAPKNI